MARAGGKDARGTRIWVAGTALLTMVSLAGCSSGSETIGIDATAGPVPSGSASSSTSAEEEQPVLSDTGLGDLKLGMTLGAAQELGLVGKLAYPNTTDLCRQYRGKQGAEYLYFTDDQLIIIIAGPKIRLDTGLGVGSVYADLRYAYGDRLDSSGARDYSRVTITAPGAPFKAHYRMDVDPGTTLQDAQVTSLALQADNQGCYE